LLATAPCGRYDEERDQLVDGLTKVAAEWAADAFVVCDGDEAGALYKLNAVQTHSLKPPGFNR
jgi:hypothetical protein